MNIDDVLSGLAATLDASIKDTTCHATVPDKLTPPCIVCTIEGITYATTFEGEMVAALGATVVARRVDARAGQAKLHQYAELTGDKSIVAAIKADPTLDGTVDSAVVLSATPPGTVSVGGVDYIGMQFVLEAMG